MLGETTVPDAGLYAGIALILGACFKFAIDLYRHVHRRHHRLTHEDMRELVRRETPYVTDRKFIAEALRLNQEQIAELTESVTRLLVSESTLSTRLDGLEQKIGEIHAATTRPKS